MLLTIALASVGCGESGNEGEPRRAKQEQQAPEPSRAVGIVQMCGERTGQDTTSTGEPKPSFVACLKEWDAPGWLVESWTGG